MTPAEVFGTGILILVMGAAGVTLIYQWAADVFAAARRDEEKRSTR